MLSEVNTFSLFRSSTAAAKLGVALGLADTTLFDIVAAANAEDDAEAEALEAEKEAAMLDAMSAAFKDPLVAASGAVDEETYADPSEEVKGDEEPVPTISTSRPVAFAAGTELLVDEGVAAAAFKDEGDPLLYTVTVCVYVDLETGASTALLVAAPCGIKTSVTFCL